MRQERLMMLRKPDSVCRSARSQKVIAGGAMLGCLTIEIGWQCTDVGAPLQELL